MSQTKPIEISKNEVEEAYKRVKANKGSAGKAPWWWLSAHAIFRFTRLLACL
jgi:hypothetical protein